MLIIAGIVHHNHIEEVYVFLGLKKFSIGSSQLEF